MRWSLSEPREQGLAAPSNHISQSRHVLRAPVDNLLLSGREFEKAVGDAKHVRRFEEQSKLNGLSFLSKLVCVRRVEPCNVELTLEPRIQVHLLENCNAKAGHVRSSVRPLEHRVGGSPLERRGIHPAKLK